MELLIVVLIFFAGFGAAAAQIAGKKGHSKGGFFAFGVVAGPLAVATAILAAPAPLPPPPGMVIRMCARCDTKQNVSQFASSYECWRCKATNDLVPAGVPPVR